MFSCFNLDLKQAIRNISPQTICYYYRLGLEESRNKKKSIYKKLDSYIKNGEIDGDTLQRDWFPQVDADIFISHSHKDMVCAHILAGWLKTTFENSINVFIDSDVWQYADNLLQDLNDIHSKIELESFNDDIAVLIEQLQQEWEILYDMKKCNTASQHVNLMLSSALHKMIDKVECLFFLNTENSTHLFKEHNSTYSPWIYHELLCAQLVRRKPLKLYRDNTYIVQEGYQNNSSLMHALMINYPVPTNEMVTIDSNLLIEWATEYTQKLECYKKYPLDALYTITNYNNHFSMSESEYNSLYGSEEYYGTVMDLPKSCPYCTKRKCRYCNLNSY